MAQGRHHGGCRGVVAVLLPRSINTQVTETETASKKKEEEEDSCGDRQKKPDRKIDRQTDRQTDRQADRQAGT